MCESDKADALTLDGLSQAEAPQAPVAMKNLKKILAQAEPLVASGYQPEGEDVPSRDLGADQVRMR